MPDKKIIDTCVHCGFCLPACPTYQSWAEEMDSPRGRIYLMKEVSEKRLPLDDSVVRHFDACLGCMGCVTACPSGVKYDALIEQMRAEIEHGYQRPWHDKLFRSMIFWLFPFPRRLKVALVFQLLYAKTGIRWLVHKLGINRLLPRRAAQMEALLPSVTARQLTSRLPQTSPALGERRARVGLMAGCVQRVYFPDVNQATIRVLNAEGCEVVVPAGQGCCGALSVHSGRENEARSFAKGMIAQFEKEELDAVIVNAAGCGSTLKEYGRLFESDPQWKDRATRFARQVKDISEFLVSLGPRAERHPVSLRVACHDACHLAHAQRILSEPRELLRGIPGIELLEVPDGDQCCGSAGIYNLLEPESSREIGKRKVANLLSIQSQLLASSNPGCTLQIQMMLREHGAHLPALHPIQILDASIHGSPIPLSVEELG